MAGVKQFDQNEVLDRAMMAVLVSGLRGDLNRPAGRGDRNKPRQPLRHIQRQERHFPRSHRPLPGNRRKVTDGDAV